MSLGEHVFAFDVDNTAGCPVAATCAGCGRPDDDLAVATAGTPLGVFCLSLCAVCAAAGTIPVHSAAGALRAVLAHCEHLGTDLDAMAEALAGEDR